MKLSLSSLLAAALGFSGVALGAFGAHTLQPVLTPEGLDWWHTGVQYHLVHAVAFALAAFVLPPGRPRTAALWGFGVGVVVFSGSLYLLALTNAKVLGAVTPVGGLAFLVGWASLAFQRPRNPEKKSES